jgi:hypothetical protein
VAHHDGHVSAVPLDALNPAAALGSYRFKVMYVHSTNTYDNLPFDDLVPARRQAVSRGDARVLKRRRRGGARRRLRVHPRGVAGRCRPPASRRSVWVIPTNAAWSSGAACGTRSSSKSGSWRSTSATTRTCRPGLRKDHLDDLLAEAPDDVRFHISRGAGESFANTLPLLHPDGYLEVQDIFVSDMDDYRKGSAARETRRVAGHMGERRAAARGRRAGRLRRPLRAVPVSARHPDHDLVHDAARVSGTKN